MTSQVHERERFALIRSANTSSSATVEICFRLFIKMQIQTHTEVTYESLETTQSSSRMTILSLFTLSDVTPNLFDFHPCGAKEDQQTVRPVLCQKIRM